MRHKLLPVCGVTVSQLRGGRSNLSLKRFMLEVVSRKTPRVSTSNTACFFLSAVDALATLAGDVQYYRSIEQLMRLRCLLRKRSALMQGMGTCCFAQVSHSCALNPKP